MDQPLPSIQVTLGVGRRVGRDGAHVGAHDIGTADEPAARHLEPREDGMDVRILECRQQQPARERDDARPGAAGPSEVQRATHAHDAAGAHRDGIDGVAAVKTRPDMAAREQHVGPLLPQHGAQSRHLAARWCDPGVPRWSRDGPPV